MTIFGESAGAVSVHAHTVSPIGEGLYRSGIAQSGTAELALLEEEGEREERFSAQLASALNCSSSNHDQEMLTCLKSADIEKLLTLLSDPESLLQLAGVGGLSSTNMQRIHSCHRLHFKKIP